MKRILLSAVAIAVVLGMSTTNPAMGQETTPSSGPQPVLTVSISGFDAIKKDLELLSQITGLPQITQPLNQLGPEGLPGVDPTKPWGVVVDMEGQKTTFFVFVPVTDLTKLIEMVNSMDPDIIGFVPDPDDNHPIDVRVGGKQLFLQQKGDWAFLADSQDTLDSVPADPTPRLEGLDKQYAIGVRAVLKNIPEQVRNQFLFLMQMGMNMAQQQQQGDMSQEMAALQMKEIARNLQELDTLQFGLGLDSKTNTLVGESFATTVEGTSLAADYALFANTKTNLAGFFLPDAAVTALMAMPMPESSAEQARMLIETFGGRALADLDEQDDLSNADRKLAKQLLTDLMDVLKKTVEARRFDFGLALVVEDDAMNLLAAGFSADTKKLEDLAKQLINSAVEENPGLADSVKLDAEEHQGVRLHVAEIPSEVLPPDVPEVIAKNGLKVVLGFSEENVFLAAGTQALDSLKQAIDRSKAEAGQAVMPFRLSLSASGIARLLEAMGEETEIPPEVIEALKQGGQNDHFFGSYKAIPKGIQSDFILQEGLLKVIGTAVKASQDTK